MCAIRNTASTAVEMASAVAHLLNNHKSCISELARAHLQSNFLIAYWGFWSAVANPPPWVMVHMVPRVSQ